MSTIFVTFLGKNTIKSAKNSTLKSTLGTSEPYSTPLVATLISKFYLYSSLGSHFIGLFYLKDCNFAAECLQGTQLTFGAEA